MSYFNRNKINQMLPGLNTVIQDQSGSVSGEFSVSGNSQPVDPSASTAQEYAYQLLEGRS
ncbi:hypothetical protein DSO57_1026681 [Entomophthora muscae]|uniref:Uncharacterized protein n=1 Tax=Entomophthora muscae TaxID=34485 RepID=A0ACC2SFA4_9FUNG|nr:hypothetical protein DSO57_1026681 [Entomophthora muscae]